MNDAFTTRQDWTGLEEILAVEADPSKIGTLNLKLFLPIYGNHKDVPVGGEGLEPPTSCV
jgi:hypothetical protein